MNCSATTKSGASCRARATANGKCALHADPARAAQLARKSRQNRYARATNYTAEKLEIPNSAKEVKQVLAEAMAKVYTGRLDPKVATAMAYTSNALLRAIEIVDLEERLAKLEGSAAQDGSRGKRLC